MIRQPAAASNVERYNSSISHFASDKVFRRAIIRPAVLLIQAAEVVVGDAQEAEVAAGKIIKCRCTLYCR